MKRTAALAIALLLAPAARAADESTLYLYAAGGAVRTSPGIVQADADARIAANGATSIDSSVNNDDTGFKVQVGWKFTPYLAFEVGYVGLGSSRYSATFIDGSARQDFKAGGILFDVLGFAPLGGDFSAYAKVGLIAATVVTNFTQSGPAGAQIRASASEAMAKANFGVGLSYDISTSIAVRLELERYARLGSESLGATNNMDMVSLGLVLKL